MARAGYAASLTHSLGPSDADHLSLRRFVLLGGLIRSTTSVLAGDEPRRVSKRASERFKEQSVRGCASLGPKLWVSQVAKPLAPPTEPVKPRSPNEAPRNHRDLSSKPPRIHHDVPLESMVAPGQRDAAVKERSDEP